MPDNFLNTFRKNKEISNSDSKNEENKPTVKIDIEDSYYDAAYETLNFVWTASKDVSFSVGSWSWEQTKKAGSFLFESTGSVFSYLKEWHHDKFVVSKEEKIFNERDTAAKTRLAKFQKEQRVAAEKRFRLIKRNEKRDLEQLEREKKTCQQWFDEEKALREAHSNYQNNQYFKDGKPVIYDKEISEGQSDINPDRVKNLCLNLEATASNINLDTSSNEGVGSVAISGNRALENLEMENLICQKNLQTSIDKEKICQTEKNTLAFNNRDLMTKKSNLENLLNKCPTAGLPKPSDLVAKYSQEEIQQFIKTLKSRNLNRNEIENLRRQAGILKNGERLILAFVHFFLWPTYAFSNDFILWTKIAHNTKLTAAQRAILGGLFCLLWAKLLILICQKLFKYFLSSSDKEEKVIQNEEQKTQKTIEDGNETKSKSLGLAERLRLRGEGSLRGGGSLTETQENELLFLMNPCLMIIKLEQITDYLVNYEPEFKEFKEKEKNNFSKLLDTKKTDQIREIVSVAGGTLAIGMVLTGMFDLQAQAVDQSYVYRDTRVPEKSIEILQPSNYQKIRDSESNFSNLQKNELEGKKTEEKTTQTVKRSRKRIKKSRKKISFRKQLKQTKKQAKTKNKKYIPLHKRTQTLAGLKKLDQENAAKNLVNPEPEETLVIKTPCRTFRIKLRTNN